MCECFEGFEYDQDLGYCTDIDECKRMEKDLNIKDACRTSPVSMASCVNKCGNYSCECRETSTTIVDLYDPNKCYLKNQIRDLMINLYVEKSDANIFLRDMNVTMETCDQGAKKIKKTFSISFNSFHQLLTNIKNHKWFPIYTDNSKWPEIEFVCKINLTFVYSLESFENLNDFKHVLIEDPVRKRCSLYDQEDIHYEKSLKFKIAFSLALVIDMATIESCTHMLERMDGSFGKYQPKIVFKKDQQP